MHGASTSMEHTHGAYAWNRNMDRKEEWSMQKHGAIRNMEQSEVWSKQKHGASRTMEPAEAWCRKRHGVERSVEQKHGTEAWS
jgi:hypothetical protein